MNLHKRYDELFIKNILLVVIIITGLIFVGGYGWVNKTLQKDRFSTGVSIYGIDVSQMTYTEAEHYVSDHIQNLLLNKYINFNYNGVMTQYNIKDLGILIDYKMNLDKAYNYNKNPKDSIAKRYNKTIELSESVDFGSVKVDKKKLYETLDKYLKPINKDKIDASVVSGKDIHEIKYKKEEKGIRVDVNKLANAVIKRVEARNFSTIKVYSEIVYPELTLDELKKNTVLISKHETIATKNENRNTNIRLMCNAINGLEIKPGEILSINQLVGERTEEKGFKAAAAIIDGSRLSNVIGGGICQVSGTLYNAALKADMEIIERSPHSWPSTYLPIGLDSTLNWDNLDLKIKNTSNKSIYIIAQFKNQKVSVGLYGKPLPKGRSIELKNDILDVIPANDTEIRYTDKLPSGVVQTIQNPHEGYIVRSYRIYLQDGKIEKEELISEDHYPVTHKIVLIGRNKEEK